MQNICARRLQHYWGNGYRTNLNSSRPSLAHAGQLYLELGLPDLCLSCMAIRWTFRSQDLEIHRLLSPKMVQHHHLKGKDTTTRYSRHNRPPQYSAPPPNPPTGASHWLYRHRVIAAPHPHPPLQPGTPKPMPEVHDCQSQYRWSRGARQRLRPTLFPIDRPHFARYEVP